jgi:hypothetical protein
MLKGIICNKWNVLLLAGALAPLALHGDTIFSNVTGTQPTGELTASYPQEYAEAFTPTANYSMTDAEVFIAYANADLFLYTNNSGTPGTEIEELASDLGPDSLTYTLETASSFAPIDLTAGTEYWLVMTGGTGAAFWGNNGSSSVPEALSANVGHDWIASGNYDAQFQIGGTLIPPVTTTPELATLPLISVGVLGLLFAARRAVKQRA